MKPTVSISILCEIPEGLKESLDAYLNQHQDWDIERTMTSAIALFLLQNGDCDRRAARTYLDSLFKWEAR